MRSIATNRSSRAAASVADATPGFRWRMQTEDGDAVAVRGFGDDRLVVNMSVWASVQDLANFAYRDSDHVAALRRKREGFRRLGQAHQVLWWVPAGHRPDVAEAEERLDSLRKHGPTPWAFTFQRVFAAPDAAESQMVISPDWLRRA